MSVERVTGPNQNNMKNYGDLQSIAQNMKPTLWVPGEKILLLASSLNCFLGPISNPGGEVPTTQPQSQSLTIKVLGFMSWCSTGGGFHLPSVKFLRDNLEH